MSSENISIGIEQARKQLGDLVTAVQQGSTVILTRNGRPAAQITPYLQEAPVYTYADLAVAFGLTRDDAEQAAQWAGAFIDLDVERKTGRIPRPHQGKGLDYQFSEREYTQLVGEWNAHQTWLIHNDGEPLYDGRDVREYR